MLKGTSGTTDKVESDMNDYDETRECHYCHRHSWVVAHGGNCPYCGRTTGKYQGVVQGIVFFGSIIGIILGVYVIYRLGG